MQELSSYCSRVHLTGLNMGAKTELILDTYCFLKNVLMSE